MKKRALYLTFILVFIISCAQVTSLNLKKHFFGRVPTQIVWLQMEGFTMEHVALLKMNSEGVLKKSAFENFLCHGNIWSYNLSELRTDAKESFFTQITGRQTYKNDCSDFESKPIWSYLQEEGYSLGFIEGEKYKGFYGVDETKKDCPDTTFYDGLTVWSFNKKRDESAKFFHADDAFDFVQNEKYYDRSCQNQNCFTPFSRNVTHIYNSMDKKKKNSLLVIRESKYAQYLRSRNYEKAREKLLEVEKVIKYFEDKMKDNQNLLFIISSTKPIRLNFPRSHKELEALKNLTLDKIDMDNSLTGTILASGARSENFCGVFKQSDIIQRIFSGPKQQGLEFSIVNPFN